MAQSLSPPMKPTPILRPARPQDIPAIAHVGSTTFTTTFGHAVPPSDLQNYLVEAYDLSTLAGELANPVIDFVVAVDAADHVIGFAQLTQGTFEPCVGDCEKPVELQRVYIDEKHHGGGIGRALVMELVRIAMQKGFRTMWLGVWEENLKAQKAYKKFGFAKVGEHDFMMGGCVQRDWIMTKSL